MAGEEVLRRCMRATVVAARAVILGGVGSVCLALLQLGDFTPVPSGWSLAIPVLGGVALGLAEMSVHELVGCVAFMVVMAPALAPLLVAFPASEVERNAVVRAALRNSLAADALLLLPCVLAGIVLGRWVKGIISSRPQPMRHTPRRAD
ncbi:MAG TPA: hypothetical protein GX515_06840 [Firmicutes bacterium]|nr:hypothetical protein [Bacillota bacterium]